MRYTVVPSINGSIETSKELIDIGLKDCLFTGHFADPFAHSFQEHIPVSFLLAESMLGSKVLQNMFYV